MDGQNMLTRPYLTSLQQMLKQMRKARKNLLKTQTLQQQRLNVLQPTHKSLPMKRPPKQVRKTFFT